MAGRRRSTRTTRFRGAVAYLSTVTQIVAVAVSDRRGGVKRQKPKRGSVLATIEVDRSVAGAQDPVCESKTPVQCCAVGSIPAPPDHAAWTLPIEPFLAEPIRAQTLAATLTKLADPPTNIR